MPVKHIAGTSVFKMKIGARNIEVIYANRTSIERNLGVDLIYYNDKYESFVLVQYKLMSDANGKAYRPDKQLEYELARMDYFYERFKRTTPIQRDYEYRLSDDGFMFKLVPNQGLHPASGMLIKGMYLTREYAKFLFSKHGPKGTKGGSFITFENAPRYLTNTEFTHAVYEGLLGSSHIQSRKISEVIDAYRDGNYTLLFAHEWEG